jgi:hypothetical protein
MPTINAKIALYIDENGNIVGSEKIEGSREIAVDQLATPDQLAAATPAADVIAVELKTSISLNPDSKTQILRVCYNRLGVRIQCPS